MLVLIFKRKQQIDKISTNMDMTNICSSSGSNTQNFQLLNKIENIYLLFKSAKKLKTGIEYLPQTLIYNPFISATKCLGPQIF